MAGEVTTVCVISATSHLVGLSVSQARAPPSAGHNLPCCGPHPWIVHKPTHSAEGVAWGSNHGIVWGRSDSPHDHRRRVCPRCPDRPRRAGGVPDEHSYRCLDPHSTPPARWRGGAPPDRAGWHYGCWQRRRWRPVGQSLNRTLGGLTRTPLTL